MEPRRTCLSAVVASLLISGTSLRATAPIAEVSQAPSAHQMLPLSSSQALLATDPTAFVQFLKAARPAPVSTEDKARALSSLPEEGEVTELNASAREKLAALIEVLRATERNSVYEIKVIALPQAVIALHARSVVLISEAALTLVDAAELQALLAHEIGHEYVWADWERSSRLADHDRLKDLELVCDGIAIVTLHGLGLDVSRLMTGVEKIGRFNRERFGTATNESNYPTLAQRRGYANVIAAWTAGQPGGTFIGAAQSPGKAGTRWLSWRASVLVSGTPLPSAELPFKPYQLSGGHAFHRLAGSSAGRLSSEH